MSPITSILGPRSNVLDPFPLEVWDQFEQPAAFPSGQPSGTSAFAHTQIDRKETAKAHVFKAHVPGLRKEEVRVKVEDGRVVKISGERNREEEEKGRTWHRVEKSNGKFAKMFSLPENAKTEEVKAEMKNGVLTVTVPKLEEEKVNVKPIQISGWLHSFSVLISSLVSCYYLLLNSHSYTIRKRGTL